MKDWITVEIDLSEYPQEVVDYVGDQMEDRVTDSQAIMDMVAEAENEIDYKSKKIKFASPIINLIMKIIEEKQADMEYEQKHS